jgi:hypothetical protein
MMLLILIFILAESFFNLFYYLVHEVQHYLFKIYYLFSSSGEWESVMINL